jgi:hypothetical protein
MAEQVTAWRSGDGHLFERQEDAEAYDERRERRRRLRELVQQGNPSIEVPAFPWPIADEALEDVVNWLEAAALSIAGAMMPQ